jgi:hypothetical protein
LTLRDGHGQAVLRYAGLSAHDASGRELVAWLELGKEELRLRVDDAGARYPVVVDPFVEQAELTPSDGEWQDSFGSSVAVSSDGSTIVAGAPWQTVNFNPGQGAVYVFVMPAGGWATMTETAELTASNGNWHGILGASVGVSSDGSTIVAGAPDFYNGGPGAAYVFVMPVGGWANMTQTAKLTASDGVREDELGFSVGVSSDGSTIVAGAPDSTINPTIGSGPGAAYVFVKPGGGWATMTETAKLTASDGTEDDYFAVSVAISGDGSTIVAGAYGATIGSNSYQGAAYAFVKPGGGWGSMTQTAKLTASDGAGGDRLGSSVGVNTNSNTIVAGAPGATINGNSRQGAAYVFVEPDSGGWGSGNETAKLTASDGAETFNFGESVAVSSDGSTIVGIPPRSAAYVFVKPGGGWATTSTYAAKLGNSFRGSNKYVLYDVFGAVAVSGDGLSIVVGDPDPDAMGAAFVFLTAPTVTFTGASASEPYLGAFNVASTTNSSTSPVYTSSGACLNADTTYTMTSGTGTCDAIVTWAGDADYAPAKAIQTTTASKIAPTVTFTGAPASEAYQGTFTVASTTNSSTSPVYTASGSCTHVGTLYTMTKGTATCTPKVSWDADSDYLKASLTETTTASKIGQTITFTTPAPSSASDGSTFPVAADSTSGLSITLSVDAGSTGVCSLGGRKTVSGVTSAIVTMLKGTGTCTIDANQAGNADYSAATEQHTLAAAQKIGQTISFTKTAPASANYQSTFPVAADSTSGQKVVFSVDTASTGVCSLTGATVKMLSGTGTCTIDANQAGNADYTAAAQQQTSAAAQKIGQTITFTTPAPSSASDGSTFPVAADSTSGLSITLSVDAGSTGVCSLGGRKTVSGVTSATVTMLKGTGTCTIDANQAGNADYSAAAQRQTSAKATP